MFHEEGSGKAESWNLRGNVSDGHREEKETRTHGTIEESHYGKKGRGAL